MSPDLRLVVAALVLGIIEFGIASYYDPPDLPGATPWSLLFGGGAGLILTSLVLLEDAGHSGCSAW